MNWILNTLQLSPRNYLAILNNSRLTPIDIIPRRNNLPLLKKYSTKYDVKNFTKSVNSVRTPLTQYQLYTCPRQINYTKQHVVGNTTNQYDDRSDLYPGKRYLNLDLNLYNDSIFTDTIFNLPTPTEEVIPIIITADTPTTSLNSIQEFEDFQKLRPPCTNFQPIVTTAINETQDLTKTLSLNTVANSLMTKSPAPDINSIPRPQIFNAYQNETAVTTTASENILIETDLDHKSLNEPTCSSAVKNDSVLSNESDKSNSLVLENNPLWTDLINSYISPNLNQVLLKEFSNESSSQLKILTSEPNSLEKEAPLQMANNECDSQATNENFTVLNKSKDTQKPGSSKKNYYFSVAEKFNTDSSILHEPYAFPGAKESYNENNTLLSFLDPESSVHSPKSLSIVEYTSVPEENDIKPNMFNSKSKDDSSSSDEFLESFRQPSDNSEGSSTASSSLELM